MISTVREASKDDVLCGYKIPAGTKIVVSGGTIHHHPEIWGKDADKFIPERFSEGDIPEQAKGDLCSSLILLK